MLINVIAAPWAILPSTYQIIREVYDRHVKGESLSKEDLLVKIGANDKPGEIEAYKSVNGVAIIELSGVIAKRMNMFQAISGGVSTQLAATKFQQALSDPSINSILLYIDSPGGSVDGTQELAQAIYAARGQKKIVAYSDGVMASAAYWIGAAADEIYISGDTVEVGSIGVVATHVDVSKAEEMEGIKTTEIVAGKYKRIASAHGPLTDAGAASIQDQVDHIYGVFVSDIAKFRGTTESKVLSGMAEGRIFMGQQAVDAGLVDGIQGLGSVVSKLSGMNTKLIQQEASEMTLKEMQEKQPAEYAKLMEEAKASLKTEAPNADIQAVIASNNELKKRVEELSAITLGQSKELTIMAEEKQKLTADTIANAILSESRIPEDLHKKVRAHVNHRDFVKSGEPFQVGSASATAFATAFKAEVADWEGRLKFTTSPVNGLGDPKDDDAKQASEEDDAALGRELVQRKFGKSRSNPQK